MKKRWIAYLMAAILLLSTISPTYAAELDTANNIGQIDVIIDDALILGKDVTFNVSITHQQYQNTLTQAVTLKGGIVSDVNGNVAGNDYQEVIFEELEPGDYTLLVTAPGFANYSQTISVAQSGYEVKLMTGFMAGDEIHYIAGSPHPGVLLIGDVNSDGFVSEIDRRALVDYIDQITMEDIADSTIEKLNLTDNSPYDINGDDVVDINDLVYFSKGFVSVEGADTIATVREFVPGKAIAVNGVSGTKVAGSLEEILTDTGSVTLTPEQGGQITEDNPVSLEFDFTAASGNGMTTDGILIETSIDNPIATATIDVTYVENDEEKTVVIPIEDDGVHYLLNDGTPVSVERDAHGNLQINLNGQVAVKKVILTITGMKNNNNLAEISRVEFVNGMEARIPEPQMDIPTNLKAVGGNEEIEVSWDPCVNVTGYEVVISLKENPQIQEMHLVTGTALTITSFSGGKDGKLENHKPYLIKVQSINGSWRSGYSDPVEATPFKQGPPDKPDNVTATGSYRSVIVSWKQMKNTLYYDLYYKVKEADTYISIENITTNQYTINGLEDSTEYEIYVVGGNNDGKSGPSLHTSAKTTSADPAQVPKYKLINTGEANTAGNHIISAAYTVRASGSGVMKDSALDVEVGTAWGTVDKNPVSYYYRETWDEGGYNALGDKGITYEFDQSYMINTIALDTALPHDSGTIFYAKIRWWDEMGNTGEVVPTVSERSDGSKLYDYLRLPQPIDAKKIQIGIARYWLTPNEVTISEVYFYHYDSLYNDIMGLYADDLHTVLRDDVTQADIDALNKRVNTQDNGEYHPDKAILEKELETAQAILNSEDLKAAIEIHNGISTSDVSRGFGGLNAWQPLGVVAEAGEKLTVYVGHNSRNSGDSTNLQLVATQYHAESSSMYTVVANLKVGINEITVPKVWTTSGIESGGALYVQYTGNSRSDRYSVRVNGGTQVPVLDLYKVTSEDERLSRTEAYVKELAAYVGSNNSNLKAMHSEKHLGSGNSEVNYDYVEKNCILGATDILLDTMMISIPTQQILSGSGSSAKQILESLDAMEEMVYLFYQHKGLNSSAPNAVDQIPKQHLNIRYQRMFSGAFMYASGNHIGIEYPETAGMVGASTIKSNNGKYISGEYFGWGIAHEIGHCINQSTYSVAEVTNNYFSVLAQAKDTNDSVRFLYDNVYAKVTSGTVGSASNVFTQLGMYWQLHLAYDTGYNYKTYADYNEQLANLFFARVDTYARTPSKAPTGNGSTALTLTGDKDQDLIRLACAAAQKDILDFFERWGKVPSAQTRAYASQFEKETRAIYYANDDARAYSLENGGSRLNADGTTEAVGDDTTAEINPARLNEVRFTLTSKIIPAEDVLGYEIVRCTISGGEIIEEPVGFTTANKFSDYLTTLNNRVVSYKVTLVDKYLNRSAVKTLEQIKIEHDGSQDKTYWTISTQNLNYENSNLTGTEADNDAPCSPNPVSHAQAIIDQNADTVYTATAAENSAIVLEFNKTLVVSGFKYMAGSADGTVPINGYRIQVREAGNNWVDVANGTFTADNVNTVYFVNDDQAYVSTYETDAVRLVITGQSGNKINISELDVLGVTGDNVDFRSADGMAAIGTLAETFTYGTGADEVIPAGSLLFTGSYKGNPAYNVVLLYDQDGSIVGGVDDEGGLQAQQIILAKVPDTGNIEDVSDGTWIYWIEPEQLGNFTRPTQVRAELYRVNAAGTNEGQRLVSDSLFVNMPDQLPDITLSSN